MKLFHSFAAFLFLIAFGCSSADKMGEMSDASTPFLGNETCPMSGEMIDEGSYIEHDGQRVYFCCDKCKTAASADPAAAVSDAYGSAMAVDNAMCPISGMAVGDASATWQGHEVGLCCSDCEGPFQEKAAEYTAKAMIQ